MARWAVACAVVAMATPTILGAQQQPSSAECVNCHLDLDEERLIAPARDYGDDIHFKSGFGCLACHGTGGSNGAIMDGGRGFLAAPARRNIPELCGRCHSDAAFMRDYDPGIRVDQVQEYRTSIHGIRLDRDNDRNVAVCVSCHPAHRIREPSDPESEVHPLNVAATCAECHSDAGLMSEYEIASDQDSLYRLSVHFEWMMEEGDLSAPTCNDCHGNHGAAPPGVAAVMNVCGQCHSAMADLINANGHREWFDEAGMAGCRTCHGNHEIGHTSDDMLDQINDEVCNSCHEQGDGGWNGFAAIRMLIDSLAAHADSSRAILHHAEDLGMEVSQALFALEDVTTALVRSRAAIHSFSVDSVRETVAAGLEITETASQRGVEALDEHTFRRQGLAVSVGLILILIAGIALKIREIER